MVNMLSCTTTHLPLNPTLGKSAQTPASELIRNWNQDPVGLPVCETPTRIAEPAPCAAAPATALARLRRPTAGRRGADRWGSVCGSTVPPPPSTADQKVSRLTVPSAAPLRFWN